MSEDMRSAAGEEQALEIARCLKGIPAGKLKVWLDFMKTWSGLPAKDKKSFMNVMQMVVSFRELPEHETISPAPLPRFPTMQEKGDITNRELDEEEKLPGVIVSFHWHLWFAAKFKANMATQRKKPPQK